MPNNSFQIDFNLDHLARQVDGSLKNYKKIVVRAASMGINKTIKTIESHVVRDIAKQTGYKTSRVRESIYLTRSKASTLYARIEAKRRPVATNLIEFVRKNRQKPAFFRRRYKNNSKSKGRKRGQFKFKGVHANAWNQDKVYRGTFIGRDKSGNLKVFRRTGGNNSKVTLVSAPSIPSTFVQPDNAKAIEHLANKRLAIEFDRAARHLIRKEQRKINTWGTNQ